jgi:hypothetical protein
MPTIFAATAMGIMNLVARGLGMFAPEVAEMDFPKPQLTFLILTFFGIIISQQFITNLPKFY